MGRVLSAFLTAGGWLLAGARTALDLIGYSTAPEDLGVAQGRLEQFLAWLLSVPWWAVWGFALVTTLWLIRVSWPRYVSLRSETTEADPIDIANEIGPDASSNTTIRQNNEEARQELMVFVLEQMLPTCQAQADLQNAIAAKRFPNKRMAKVVLQGIRYDEQVEPFWSSYRRLQDAFGSSPPDPVPFDELVRCMDTIERGYSAFCRETYELGSNRLTDDELLPLWQEWQERHERLVEAYEAVKRNPKFHPRLFRPLRPSRWRDVPKEMLAQDDHSSASRTV